MLKSLTAPLFAVLLTCCAAAAKTDAVLLGFPPEPLEPGKHLVITDTRVKTIANCTRLTGIPDHACTYRRPGDSIPTVLISIEDVGLVYKHELYHVQQANNSEPFSHKGWTWTSD